jgi:hypothetical protein
LVADELMIKSDDFLVGRLSGVGGWPVNPSIVYLAYGTRSILFFLPRELGSLVDVAADLLEQQLNAITSGYPYLQSIHLILF